MGKYNSRKLLIAMFLEGLATFLLWQDKISGDNWEVVTLVVAATYLPAQAWVDGRAR